MVVRGCCVAAIALAGALHPFPHFTEPNCARADFQSRGQTVRAELCRATRDAGAGRAVVILHGCGGFSTFDHRLATGLPNAGISTLYVDYFEPTPPPGSRGFCPGRTRPAAFDRRLVFSRWVEVVDDAGAVLARTRGIAPNRVGLVGWSLGGGLAIDVATLQSPRTFDAVVAFSAGSYGHTSAQLASLPPTLLLSGGRTDAVPLSSTLELYRAARAAGVKASLFVYPHGSHAWPREQGTVGIARAAHFLRANL